MSEKWQRGGECGKVVYGGGLMKQRAPHMQAGCHQKPH